MKPRVILLLAIGLSSCADLEPPRPFVNEAALRQQLDTMQRAALHESQGDSPGDAWQRSTLENSFDRPFGGMGGGMMTPIAGFGWSSEFHSNR